MKNILNTFILFFLFMLAIPQNGFSQGNSVNELPYEVNKINPYISISKEELSEAKTLIDLNSRYKSSWVKEYLSVEISASREGEMITIASKNNILSKAQKDLMNHADVDKDISVSVKYMPDNNLTHNDAQEMVFSFSIEPEKDAHYIGGQQKLKEYLKEKAIDKIPSGTFEGYDLTAISFIVNEEGEITNANISIPSENEKMNAFLLKIIRTMPCWKPAEHAKGIKVKQEFALTVGNHKNCMIYTLNVQSDSIPDMN